MNERLILSLDKTNGFGYFFVSPDGVYTREELKDATLNIEVENGLNIKIPVENIPTLPENSNGVRLCTLPESSKIVDFEIILNHN